MPPLKTTKSLSLPGQPVLAGTWCAIALSGSLPSLHHLLQSSRTKATTLQLTKEELGHREVRCLSWKQLGWNKLGSAYLSSPQLHSLPQNGVLEFYLGIPLHWILKPLLQGPGLRSVIKGPCYGAQLIEERQHRNRPSALSLQLRAAPASRCPISELVGKKQCSLSCH